MLNKIKHLTPRNFENMSYDLLMLLGIRNLVWRTPGSDGGRDLEGLFLNTDFAGGLNAEKWYFECKRYAAAIPWPIVYEKISYAANQNADYLLFLTTSSFSPQCEDEVANWNTRGGKPKVRQWPGHHLAELISAHSKLSLKYGLTKNLAALAPSSMLSLATELAKSVQSSYAAEEFRDTARAPMVFASALADLLTSCITDIEHPNEIMARPFQLEQDGCDWLDVQGTPHGDRYALRAAAAAIRLQFSTERCFLQFTPNTIMLGLASGGSLESLRDGIRRNIEEICFWANLEPFFKDTAVEFRDRRK